MKIISGILFSGACFLLYYGGTMLLLVPGYPGESYFAAKRMLYGALPTLLSAGFLVSAGWLWTRSGSTISLKKAIANSFSWAVGAVTLFWLVLVIIAGIRQG
ncbi:MAG: hypothetical protein LAP40_27765 [Acidobacteriia bacterium]|nr:hypothetical protein [Terriglobia bacterium]